MTRRNLIAAMFCLSATGLGWSQAVPGASEAEVKAMTAKVNSAMQGYNSKNHKAFYKDWAKQMAAIQTEQAFNSLYVNMYHKDYGAYKSGTVDPARSSFSGMNGLLVYKATFAKKAGSLSVNWFKEGSEWRIQQIQLGP
jgi:hypothetical protein